MYDGVSSPDFQCFCAPDVEYKKLENLTGLFSNRFGYAPRSFRGGRFGVGENTIQSLHQLGYWVDTSVTPHMKWVNEQGTVDFRFAPEAPYFPASSFLIRADDGGGIGLLEVPVTMRPRLLRSPQWFRPWFSSVREMNSM